MAIIVDPGKIVGGVITEAKIKRIIGKDFSLKRKTLAFLDSIPWIDKKDLVSVAAKTMRSYKKRLKAEDGSNTFETEIKSDPRLLIQRLKNEVILQVSERVKENYRGKTFTWLPSEAEEPDPEHQLNYGKTFVIGDDEIPGERIGCQCGMEIHGDEEKLDLT